MVILIIRIIDWLINGVERNSYLVGLVNNAGISIPGPVECISVEEIRRQFEVNLFGAIGGKFITHSRNYYNHSRRITI